MKTIEYRVTYQPKGTDPAEVGPNHHLVLVTTRDINTGFTAAVKKARADAYGDEIVAVEFWSVV